MREQKHPIPVPPHLPILPECAEQKKGHNLTRRLKTGSGTIGCVTFLQTLSRHPQRFKQTHTRGSTTEELQRSM